MSKITRRIAATAATSLIVAGGMLAGTTQTASAESWDGVNHMSAAEVQEKLTLMKGATTGTCILLPGPWKAACKLAGAASIPSEFRDAAAQGCGLDLKWRATGSAMSYDKAEYAYSLSC